MKSAYLFVISTLLLGACTGDKTAEIGAQGMNAAANIANDADRANPAVDNPNVVGVSEAANPNAPVMHFAVAEHDFGDIQAGTVVRHTFEFTNAGKSPLLIEDATASCGCTTPQWTKEPVAPGGKGSIEVQFDSHGKAGLQNKSVSIRANTQPSVTTVTIRTNVLAAPASGPAVQ